MQGLVMVYLPPIRSFITNMLRLYLLHTFVHKASASGFTKFSLAKTQCKLDSLRLLINSVVKLHKYNCTSITESDQRCQHAAFQFVWQSPFRYHKDKKCLVYPSNYIQCLL
jgi:hypothetical protein